MYLIVYTYFTQVDMYLVVRLQNQKVYHCIVPLIIAIMRLMATFQILVY